VNWIESPFAPTTLIAANLLRSQSVPASGRRLVKIPCSVTAVSASKVSVPTLRN
jgi:hypothetical protein